MYKCALCRKTTQPREQMNKLILEKRYIVYPNGARGWEIVREMAICYSCATMQPKGMVN